MITTVTTKGQVTIPKAVREHLGIAAGSKVEFQLGADGNIILVPQNAERPPNRFEKLRGHAGPGLSTDEIMALSRGDDHSD